INDNDSEIYQSRCQAGAFFQGGSNAPDGQWILLEFWQPMEKTVEFVRLINDAVRQHLIKHLTTIPVNLYAYPEPGALTLCLMIAEETKCPYDAGSWGLPFTFLPEDNITHQAVYKLLREFDLIKP